MTTRFLVLIKREIDPWEVTPFETRAEADAYADRAGAQWSETYVAEIRSGPRDVVGDLGTCPTCGGSGKAASCTGCAGERNSHVAECGVWRDCYTCRGTGKA